MSVCTDTYIVARVLHVLGCFDDLTLQELQGYVGSLRTRPEILDRLVRGQHVTVSTRRVQNGRETQVYSLRRTP